MILHLLLKEVEMNSSYKLLNIILLESSFKREMRVDFSDEMFKSNVDISIENQNENNQLFITLKVKFEGGIDGNKQINAMIRMLGIFNFSDKNTVSIENFEKINGPAIIFPFIREHLANISLKAGINPILLPPINFVKLVEQENLGGNSGNI